MRLASPLYIYPSSKWDPFLNRKPTPALLVANPASGPGAGYSGTYGTYLRLAVDHGIEAYGYVDLDYMNIPLSQVYAWVDKWHAWYNNNPIKLVKGIFYDEYDKTLTKASLLRAQQVYDYAKAFGLKVSTNPGTSIDKAYLPFCDYTMVFEGTAKDFLSRGLPAWCSDPVLGAKAWYCIHTCSPAQLAAVHAKLKTVPQGLGWVTPDTMSNPYDTMPPLDCFSAVDSIPDPVVVVPTPTPTVTGVVTLDLVVNGINIQKKVIL